MMTYVCPQGLKLYFLTSFFFFLEELFVQMDSPSHSFKTQSFKIKVIKLFKTIF